MTPADNEQHAWGLSSPFAGDAASAEEASTIFFDPAGLTPLKGTPFVPRGFAIKPTANFHDNGSTVRAAKRLTFRGWPVSQRAASSGR